MNLQFPYFKSAQILGASLKLGHLKHSSIWVAVSDQPKGIPDGVTNIEILKETWFNGVY